MNQINIEQLSARMVALGFDTDVATQLICHTCFRPQSFTLTHKQSQGTDHFQFTVFLQRGGSDEYIPAYYTAVMRRMPLLGDELLQISLRMQAVDWNELLRGRTSRIPLPKETLYEISSQLKELEQHGNKASLVKYVYWAGTALENMVPDLSIYKARYEIFEKFYCGEGSAIITFEEAIRFLNNKWLEKQALAKRKAEGKGAVNTVIVQAAGPVASRSRAGVRKKPVKP